MSFPTLFLLPQFNILSKNIIATLLYDLGRENLNHVNRQSIEDIYHKSISEGAKDILQSNRTSEKILSAFQEKNLASRVEIFRHSGHPLAENYFERLFSSVISARNAKKIVPKFLDIFRKEITDNKSLLKAILLNYKEAIQNGQWDDDFLEQFDTFIQTYNNNNNIDQGHTINDAPFFLENGSICIPPWNPREHGLPVRALRKLEKCLQDHPYIYINGKSGLGKSFLVAAYLDNLISQQLLEPQNVFYYRFVSNASDYNSFFDSLSSFLKNYLLDVSGDSSLEHLLNMLIQSDQYFVLDDLHNIDDEKLLKLISQIWRQIGDKSELFKGKLILINRRLLEDVEVKKHYHLIFKGLSVSEGITLLRDTWKLEFSQQVSLGELSGKFLGYPLLMSFFRYWWENESHTDTELERFINNMPKAELELRNYIFNYWYNMLEEIDHRLNNFLSSVSPFRKPETEDFFIKMYEKAGGSDMHHRIETLIEQYKMRIYYDNLNKYELPPLIKEYYYQVACKNPIKRILHQVAGELYEERFQSEHHLSDIIEGIYHYIQSNQENKAEGMITCFLDTIKQKNLYRQKRVLDILNKIDIDRYKDVLLKSNFLYVLGNICFQSGELDTAEEALKESEALQESPNDLRASILYVLAQVKQAQEKVEEAIEYYQQALNVYQEIDNREGIGTVSDCLVDFYLKQGEINPASELIGKNLHIYEELNDLPSLLKAHRNLGLLYSRKNELMLACRAYERSVELAEELGKKNDTVQILNNLAILYKERCEWEKAIVAYTQKLSYDQEIHTPLEVAATYKNIGDLHLIINNQESWEKALSSYETSQELYKQNNNHEGFATLCNAIGVVYAKRGEYSLALEFHQKALSLFQKLENLSGIVQSYINIGKIRTAQKKWKQALEFYQKSLEFIEASGSDAQKADIYEEIATAYYENKDNERAMELYKQSIDIKETLEDREGIANLQYKIGNVLKDYHDWEKAITAYQESRSIFEELGDQAGMAKNYQNLGSIYQELEEWTETIECYQKALGLYKQIDNILGMAKTLYLLGNINHDQGNWQEAKTCYYKSRDFFEQAGDLHSISQTLGNISSIEFEQQEHVDAISHQVEILLYFQAYNKHDLVKRVLNNLVACHQELGHEVFQPILNTTLERISLEGVSWGRHKVLNAQAASAIISKIFYSN